MDDNDGALPARKSNPEPRTEGHPLALDISQELRGVCNLKGIAPVEELQRIQTALTTQSLVDPCGRGLQPGRQGPHAESERSCSVAERLRQRLVRRSLKGLLGLEGRSRGCSLLRQAQRKQLDYGVPKLGTLCPSLRKATLLDHSPAFQTSFRASRLAARNLWTSGRRIHDLLVRCVAAEPFVGVSAQPEHLPEGRR